MKNRNKNIRKIVSERRNLKDIIAYVYIVFLSMLAVNAWNHFLLVHMYGNDANWLI